MGSPNTGHSDVHIARPALAAHMLRHACAWYGNFVKVVTALLRQGYLVRKLGAQSESLARHFAHVESEITV
jgi:hypothetical protein